MKHLIVNIWDEKSVKPLQVLQESLQIPGTNIYLVHHSSETYGYMSTIMILLTGKWIPSDLVSVRLRILVEGIVYERIFEADRELKYLFAWERRNAYNQKVYGLVKATSKILTTSFFCSLLLFMQDCGTRLLKGRCK